MPAVYEILKQKLRLKMGTSGETQGAGQGWFLQACEARTPSLVRQ